MTATGFPGVSVDSRGGVGVGGAWVGKSEEKMLALQFIKTLSLCPRYTYTYWKDASLRQEA